MTDIYDDPDLVDSTATTEFAPTIKFNQIGDRVRGVVTKVSKFEGKGQDASLKYALAEVKAKQEGRQALFPEAEVIAGSKNLKGQLMVLKPRRGDTLDIEFIESRPSGFASPTKIFKIIIEHADTPTETSDGEPGDDDEPDLFT